MLGQAKKRIRRMRKDKMIKLFMGNPIPPTSIRYCHGCEKNTTFRYNPKITHSQCIECGFTFATKKRDEK